MEIINKILIRTKYNQITYKKMLWTFLCLFILETLSCVECSTSSKLILKNVEFKNSELNGNFIEISGSNFNQWENDELSFIPTKYLEKCDEFNQPLLIVQRKDESIVLTLNHFDFDGLNFAYLCYRSDNNGVLHHMGIGSKFNDVLTRKTREISEHEGHVDPNKLKIEGLRIESSEKGTDIEDGIPDIISDSKAVIRVFGTGLTENTVITFTHETNTYGGSCQLPSTEKFKVIPGSLTTKSALIAIVLPRGTSSFYICAKNERDVDSEKRSAAVPYEHQGSESWLRLNSHETILPLWLSICVILFCLSFSALFSGLNLGLMSLDRTELKILCNTGGQKEREYARIIQPVRNHGNFLLCSILLGNVLVNSTFTIILDGLTSGLVAVVCSTIAIVLFGEITPQAICSRHGLAVGAKTIWITKGIMVLTSPLSWPVSKVLDCILGEEIGNVYNRERLKELVRVTNDQNDLDKDEINMISGALELRKKTVGHIMTHLEDIFMLPVESILDFETISEIMKTGFSRIPVFEKNRTNIVTMLYIKDLAFVDPDDNTQLKTLCEFYQNPCHFVFEDTKLDVMFRQFKEGNKGHMAFVHAVNNESEFDPFYETIGLVTMEDVIEELIQAEIIDETDNITDNRTKKQRVKKAQDFTFFAERRENIRVRISPQLTLATFQYLRSTIDAFKDDQVSETILRRLLNQEIVHNVKTKGKERTDPSLCIYQQGKPVDFFVLVLEGRVEVTVGKESLVFESGPFTYFGIQALTQNIGVDSPQQQLLGSLQSLNMDALMKHTFVPDYSVRAVTDVVYIAIKRTLYLAAKRASLMEKCSRTGEGGTMGGDVDAEVEKLLHSLDEEERCVGAEMHNLNGRNETPTRSKASGFTISPPMSMEPNGPSSGNPSIVTFQATELENPMRTGSITLIETEDLPEETEILLPKKS